jgi:predicted nucleic acid-binding protein
LICYFDASALVKRYVEELHSAAVNRMLSRVTALTSRLSQAEIASALARRYRNGDLKIWQCNRLLKAVQQDMASLYVVEISPELCSLACRLLLRHKLRASDSLHLASALLSSNRANLTIHFVGFDNNLNAAARKEGLRIPAF